MCDKVAIFKETCQSGRMYLFAKEADLSKGLGSSNLPVSAKPKPHTVLV